MKKTSAIALLMGGLLVAAPAVYSGEQGSMSDVQHRKTMGGGMHHPKQASETIEDAAAEKKPASMSDMQHRKMMGGSMHHPEQASETIEDATAKNKPASMSDTQHRKMMGGGTHHPGKE